MADMNGLAEDGHERAGLRLIRRAIHGRWQIPDLLLEQLPKHVISLLVNARNEREKLRAAEVLVAMNRDNIAALVHADKIERLDSGKATDRVETMQSISDAQLSAAAKVISKRLLPDEPQEKPARKAPARKRK